MADAIRALLEKHGRTTTSFQILEPGLSFWLAADKTACAGYFDTGSAWVVAGEPICAPEHLQNAFAELAEAAAAAHRRLRFFATETDCFGTLPLRHLHIGEQPVWDPHRWSQALQAKRSLREQLRRARAKGVVVHRVSSADCADPQSAIRQRIDAMIRTWLQSRAMAPMGFIVQLSPFDQPGARRVFVAEHDGRVVGLLSAAPILAAHGWFFEDVLRAPSAPNGTIELLFDHAMRAVAAEGSRYVTYGLAPLANTPHRALRWIAEHTRWLYDFEGLWRFKAKLQPIAWQPVYLAYPARERGVRAVIDSLRAFARGSFLRFGLATALHRAPLVTLVLALLLVPWTALLVVVDGAWFPSETVRLLWVAVDVVLLGGLLALSRRWRRWLAMALAGGAATDFSVGCLQLLTWNATRTNGALDTIGVAAALLAPLSAAAFLWAARRREQIAVAVRDQWWSGPWSTGRRWRKKSPSSVKST